MSGVVVVTDSTSSLVPSVANEAGLVVVPLQIIVDGWSRPESFHLDLGSMAPGAVAAALREGRSVSTSRPAPEAFASAYESIAVAGASAIVSVHLSAGISGTCDAAMTAARSASLPVIVVDSRTVAPACGFAALAAASVARAGGTPEEVAQTARRRAAAASTWFCVENLDYLRRGGRIGAAQAMLGSALAVKPLLTVTDGKIAPLERVRTMSRALGRLEQLGISALDELDGPGADVAVVHLDNRSAADRLARALAGHAVLAAGGVTVSEVSAVLGVHCGPGTVGLVVSPRI
ncbi:MAG: DegV family protein [Microlunatus sp.]